MSDFFTKKQRKYWCDVCHMFIEYTKNAIEYHNQSKNHIHNLNSGNRYKNTKKKFNKYIENVTLIHNVNDVLLGNKHARESIVQSSNYLNEIKEEIMKEELNKLKEKENAVDNGNSSNNEENKCLNRKWGVFWDEKYKCVYYFNFDTTESSWDKPDDFDGKEEDINEVVLANTKEGNVGEWEDVEEGKSVFGKRKCDNDDDNDGECNIKENNNNNGKEGVKKKMDAKIAMKELNKVKKFIRMNKQQ